MPRTMISAIVLCGMLLAIPLALAQDEENCPALVQEAYTLTQTACENTGRDQACYGNTTVEASPQEDAVAFEFDSSGDLVEIGAIDTLRLSSMDTAADQWGISLMRLSATLPEEDSSAFVELFLFGNVEIDTPETASDSETTFGPMQAFLFRSGMDDRPCEEAPDSGILIQTPAGAGSITFLINEVTIELGSTVYMQAQPADEMILSVVDGQATVTAFGTTVVAPAGTQVRIPLDANGIANAAPIDPEPYDEIALAVLPVNSLSQEITIAPPLTEEQGETSRVPLVGSWRVTGTCTLVTPGAGSRTSPFPESVVRLTLAGDNLSIPEASAVPEWTKIEEGVYQNDEQAVGIFHTLRVISPQLMEEERELTLGGTSLGSCTLTWEFVE